MEGIAEAIEALHDLLEVFILTYGPNGTILIFLGIYVLFTSWRIYNDIRKDKEVHLALKAMESAVQRSASDARAWRIYFLKKTTDWTDEEIDRLINRGEFSNPQESRRALEGRKRLTETRRRLFRRKK